MSKVKSTKFRFIAFLLCALLVISGFVPVMGGLRAKATDTITVYFDTGGSGHSSNGWTEDMTVYFHTSDTKDTNDQGGTAINFTAQMTPTTLPSVVNPSGNGKLWKVELPSTDAGKYLSFSGNSGSCAHWNRTAMRDGPQVKNNIVIYASGTEQDGYWQSWCTTLKQTVTDYAGEKFYISNMTSQTVAFDLLFYSDDGTNTLLWRYDENEHSNQVIPARKVGGVEFTIPGVTSGTTPYSGVMYIRRQISGIADTYSDLDGSANATIDSMYNNSEKGTLIKNHTFTKDAEKNKCIGKTLKYGITQFGTKKPNYADDADYKTLTFNSELMSDPQSVTQKTLYLEKGTDEKPGFAQYGSADNIKVVVGGVVDHYTGKITGGTTYSVKCLDPDGHPEKASGNASYVVEGGNSDGSLTLPANTVFSIRCFDVANNKYDIYNLFWNDTSKDLCILAYGDAAQVTDTRTVQGINILNGQKYMTVKADFFDYQYDSFNNSKYTYEEYNISNGSHSSKTEDSQLANAKRPYLAINEALSNSSYGNTPSPMYLGQFWLPFDDTGDYSTSNGAYSTNTAKYQRAGNNGYRGNNQRYYVSGEQGYGFWTNFGFGYKLNHFVWGANLAFRNEHQDPGYKPYDAVAQGLVADYLDGSNASTFSRGGALMSNGSSPVKVPYFYEGWWTGTYDTSQGAQINKSNYLTTYNNLDFPFFEIDSSEIEFVSEVDKGGMLLSDNDTPYDGKYYLFDSQKYSVRVKTENGTTYLDKHNEAAVSNNYQYMVYDNYGEDGSNEESNKGRTYGLFPFNAPLTSGTNYDRADLHYGFGIRYDIDFYMTEHGTVDDSTYGTPITFTFQGDDDVWVFLDGRLILDMGGAHKNAVGEINFKNKTTWISAGASYSAAMQTNGQPTVTTNFSGWGDRLAEGEHTITMFYMERGMLNSNLYCMFNLPTNITKVQLQEDTDFGNVNAGFAAATKYVADSDVFNYAIENKGTSAPLGSAYGYPTVGTITRSNSESGTAKTTSLNNTASVGTRQEARTRQVFDSGHLYLDTSDTYGKYQNDWESAGAVFAAYFYDYGGNHVSLKFMTSAGDGTHLYKCDYVSGKLGVYFFRLPGGFSYKDQNFDNNNSNDNWNAANAYLKSVNGRTNKDYGWWNRTKDGSDLDYTKNRFSLAWKDSGDLEAPSYGTNVTVEETYYITVPDTKTYNFNTNVAPDSNTGYQPLVSANDGSFGVTYLLEDMFALNSNATVPVTYQTRQYNTTGNADVVSLQYGQMATLSKQFSANSSVKVTQLDKLSSPSGGTSRLNGACDDTGTRTVSKYYTTYLKTGNNTGKLSMLPSPGIYKGDDVADISTPSLKHADAMYEEGSPLALKSSLNGKNYSNNTIINLQRSQDESTKDISATFMLSDPEKGTNTNVHLRQVIINSVNTVDLRLAKYMTAVTAPSGKTFSFTIKFTGVFGDTSAAAVNKIDTSAIKYIIDDDANTERPFATYSNAPGNKSVTIAIEPNHSITIKDIPVGTDYQIIEATDTTYTLDKSMSQNLEYDVNGNINVTELTKDTDVDVFNKIKTGAIKLRKTLLDTNNAHVSMDTEFDIKITVTSVPSGVGSIGSYAITAHKKSTPDTKTQVLWDKDMTDASNPVYSLTVKVKPSVATSYDNDVILEGFPVGTIYNVTEEPKSGFDYQNTTFSDNNKKVDNYYLGASATVNPGESNDTANIDLITITNKIIPIIMPTTGASGIIFIFPLGILAITLSGAAFVIYNRRMNSGKKAPKGRYVRK